MKKEKKRKKEEKEKKRDKNGKKEKRKKEKKRKKEEKVIVEKKEREKQDPGFDQHTRFGIVFMPQILMLFTEPELACYMRFISGMRPDSVSRSSSRPRICFEP